MRKIDEAVLDIKNILNDIDRTQECDGQDTAKINELCDEILSINCIDCIQPKATSAMKAQTKLKEYIERINQPEYKDVVWKKDEVVLLLQELIAE